VPSVRHIARVKLSLDPTMRRSGKPPHQSVLFKGGDVTAGIRAITGIIHCVQSYFQKNCGEDMCRCPHKDYSSLNRW
jgi:hypothetical protein